jgi:hypothetical protein
MGHEMFKNMAHQMDLSHSLRSSVADPRSRIRCFFNPLDPGSGIEKRSGSGMIIQDHFSKSLEKVFWVKNT